MDLKIHYLIPSYQKYQLYIYLYQIVLIFFPNLNILHPKSFYPFSPNSEDEKTRNKDNEKDLYNHLMRRKVNLENAEKKWLGIWGIPF